MVSRLRERLRRVLKALFRRRRLEEGLDEELRFHIDSQTRQYIDSGLAPREARRRARADFGGLEAIKEECREARPTHALETTLQDLRHGLRLMARNPGFTVTAVATLALTVGAISTVLTVAHAFYLKPLPVPDPDEVVEVRATRRQGAEKGFVSHPDYRHFRDRTRTLEGLAAVYPTAPLFVSHGERAREVGGAVVSANFFSLLGVEPVLGRAFRPDEDRVPARDRVAVLGHEFWNGWFQGSPEVLGATIEINGEAFTIVGVAPPWFPGITSIPNRIYIPTMSLDVGYRWCDDAWSADCTMLRMFGRPAAGSDVEAVRGEMRALIPPRWHDAEPAENSGVSVAVARGAEPNPSDTRFIELLSWVAGALLLVCCANLAGLLIARGRSRRRELSIRSSLGAPRRRLVRQLLNESLLLAIVGGALGVVLSLILSGWIEARFYSADAVGRPLHYDFGLEPAIVVFVLGVAICAGLLFGILPALRSTRISRSGDAVSLKPGGRGVGIGATSRRDTVIGRWLLGSQAAVAVALVTVAALLAVGARSLITGSGFDPAGVALLRLRPRLVDYSPERAQAYVREVVERLERSPGVEAVGTVGTGTALVGFGADVAIPSADVRPLNAGYVEVGPGYFRALGIPRLRGREFTERDDRDSTPVAVVSEALARRLWGEAGAVGATILVDDRRHTVVGVVGDVGLQSRAEPLRPYVYLPFWQNPNQVDARLQVRVEGDPGAMLSKLARAVHRVDPRVPITDMTTLPSWLEGRFRPLRMGVTAVTYAAVLAVVLSAVGLYSSLAFAVSRRTREIGVRLAVGASSGSILTMVLRQGMAVVVAGVAAGIALAVACTRVLRHVLYGAESADMALCGAAVLLFLCIGLIASSVPARRAARIDPMEALGAE